MKVSVWIVAAVAVASTVGLQGASASSALLGTATGDMVIHYNSGSETPTNQAYLQTQNTVFNFNPALTSGSVGYGPSHFWQTNPNQFAFGLTMKLPTNNNTVVYPGPVSAFNANPYGTVGSESVDWAVTSLGLVNSPFRGGNGDGSSITITSENLTQSGTVFTLDISGSLKTDGLIHWATSQGGNLDGTSNMTGFPWSVLFNGSDRILFDGTFTYDSSLDTTAGADVYHGTVQFSAVPVPAAVWGGLVLLGAMGGAELRRRRRLA